MSIVKDSLIFVLGASVGSCVTWYIMKNKENDKIQKAVDEVKESYNKSKQNVEMKKDIFDDTTNEIKNLNQQIETSVKAFEGYTSNVFDNYNFKQKAENMPEDQFYISSITLKEFDEEEECSPSYLVYYAKDDVVVDSSDYSPMYDPEVFLGKDFRKLFEDDEAIHIRNTREGYVYEVVIDRKESLDDVLGETYEEE